MEINIKNVSKSYSDQQVLKGISFRLKKGEIVGFLGSNGAGKTTLMKILTGYLSQWEGNVCFGRLNLKKNLLQIQQKIGYLPENNPLYLEMCVEEYLRFTANLYKIKKPPIAEIVIKTGLENFQNKKIEVLSKGYRQRVGLAATLLHNPELLILDEPTTGLDPNQLIEIRKLIREMGKEKIVLLSTHILQEVNALCDRVVIINKGEIVLDDYLKNLRSNQKQTIKVTFDHKVETSALQNINHVLKVVNTCDSNYELHTEASADMRVAVFDFANDNGLKILNLQLKDKNLESIFSHLTQN